MRPEIKLAVLSSFALILLPSLAAPPDKRNLKDVLHELDVSAAGFHATSADVEFDAVQTDPIYEKDIDKGAVEYKRNGKSFKMIVHLREEAVDVQNGKPAKFKPVPKDLLVSGGKATLYEALSDQVHTKRRLKIRELCDSRLWRQRLGTGGQVGNTLSGPRAAVRRQSNHCCRQARTCGQGPRCEEALSQSHHLD